MIFVVPIFFVLGGCPPPNPDDFIFNSYGADVAVESRHGEVDWPAGTSIELESYHFTKDQSDTGSSTYISFFL